MLLGMKSRFLMILRVAEYHQFWGFQGYPGTKSEF